MRDDFCAVILTHGRPNKVPTYNSLFRHGYTGRIFIVVDDEDESLPDYIRKFGEESVLVFSKIEVMSHMDVGDNFEGRMAAITFARNAIFDLIREQGFKYFIQLDDDYTQFSYRFDDEGRYGTWPVCDLDAVLSGMVDFLEATPFLTVAMSQGGDWIGGAEAKSTIGSRRKAMNSFVCSTERPFPFLGRLNEDVVTYTTLQRRGLPFLTFLAVQIVQIATQKTPGGMSGTYADSGTYVKSFYSVMYAPSCVSIGTMKGTSKNKSLDESKRMSRIHHKVSWNNTAPKIIPERLKRRAK